MEYIDGVFVNDIAGLEARGIKRADVMTEVSKVFADMIYDHGFVHCDPHPGNVLVRVKPGTRNKAQVRDHRNERDVFSHELFVTTSPRLEQIVLLDHGLYKELPNAFRYKREYCLLPRLQRTDSNPSH